MKTDILCPYCGCKNSAPVRYHKYDANKHTLEVVKAVPAELVRRLTALLHDIGKSQTQSSTGYVKCNKCHKPIEVTL